MPPAANPSAKQNKERLNLRRIIVSLERGLIAERDSIREAQWSICLVTRIHIYSPTHAHFLNDTIKLQFFKIVKISDMFRFTFKPSSGSH